MNELRTLLPYFRPYQREVVLGLICVVLANAFQIAGPWFMMLAIDSYADPAMTSATVLFYSGMIILVAFVGGVFRFAMRQYLNGVSRRIETDIRDAYFRHLLRLDATFYGTIRTGDLMSRATNDTMAVRMAAGPAIMYTMNTVASFTFALGFMLWMSPRLTLYAMVPMIVLPPIVLLFGRIIHRRFEEIQEQFSALSTFVQENLTGVRLVRAYTQEAEQSRQFDAFNRDYRARNMKLVLTAGAFHPGLMLISGAAMVLVTGLGAMEVMDGAMTIGEFVAFGFYLTLLIWPMIALGWVVNLYQRAAASMGRLNRIFEAQPAVTVPASPVSIDDVTGAISFRNVSFAYPDTDRDVLSDVSFDIEAGQTVALVGPTGSGKSTLIALLARLYDPTAGSILLDEIPLTQVDPETLRARIGMVPQDRGINLSGGQKQRATLARAVARDPLILVLDDALSAVDTHTEAAILEDLRDVARSRTALIISHRVSAVMNADRILVLDGGRIVQEGIHSELISEEGTYARLLRRQLLEDDLASGTAVPSTTAGR